jgi:hypothetical protein
MAKKSPKANLQNLPAPAAEFIRVVIKKMRYRRKVRADVMAELAAHFEDELRDCTNDEETEQKAQRLIEEFGDAKLLAVLLRRAKKRCRPLWRTVVARTFQTAGILIFCLIVYTVWFLSGEAVIDTDYVAKLNEITRPVANESLNAASLYNKATEMYEQSVETYNKEYESGLELPDNSRVTFSMLLQKNYGETNTKQKQLIQKWMDENEQIFDLIITGTKKPYYWHKYESNDGKLLSILFPNLAGFRQLAKAQRWRAYFHAEERQYKDALTDMITCFRVGRQLIGDRVLVEQLVGIAVIRLANDTIRDILSEHEINSDTLAELQRELEEIADDKSFAINLKTERLMFYDELQRCFTAGDDGHIAPKHYIELASRAGESIYIAHSKDVFIRTLLSLFKNTGYILFLHPDRDETLKSGNAIYDYYEELALQTPAKIQTSMAERDVEIKQLCKKNFMLSILMPELERLIRIGYRARTDYNATLITIAVLRYKQDKGNYPESLEELVTLDYLKELPLDPWSDKPLVYRKTDGDFILYSVGWNFVDDGGKVYRDKEGRPRPWADEGDAVFWPVAK